MLTLDHILRIGKILKTVGLLIWEAGGGLSRGSRFPCQPWLM
jgi:hypothetical protein